MRIFWFARWVSAALLTITISCASAPPQDLIVRDDHAGLTRWQREAAALRDKAEEIRRMAKAYAKPDYLPSPKQTKEELIAHCQLFITLYSEAAWEVEALPKLLRDLDKTTS